MSMNAADIAAITAAAAAGHVQATLDLRKLDEKAANKRDKAMKDRRKELDKTLKTAGITDDADRKTRIDAVMAAEFPPVASAAPGTPLPPPVASAAAPVAGEVVRFETASHKGVVRGTDIVISNKPATGAPIVHQVTLEAWDAAVAKAGSVDVVAAQVINTGVLAAPKSKSTIGASILGVIRRP